MAKLKLNRAAKYLALSILMVAAGLFGVRYLAEEPGTTSSSSMAASLMAAEAHGLRVQWP
jgi:hypothetical protein